MVGSFRNAAILFRNRVFRDTGESFLAHFNIQSSFKCVRRIANPSFWAIFTEGASVVYRKCFT